MDERFQLISMRLPVSLLKSIKKIAAEEGIPYQTLIRQWLTRHVTQHATAPELPEETVYVYVPTTRRLLGRSATQTVDTPPGTPEPRRPERG